MASPTPHDAFLGDLWPCATVFERGGAHRDVHVREARLILRLLGDDVRDADDFQACVSCVDTRGGGRLTLPQFLDLIHLRASRGSGPLMLPEDDLSRAFRLLQTPDAQDVATATVEALVCEKDQSLKKGWTSLMREAGHSPTPDRLDWQSFRRLFLPPVEPA